MTTTHEEIVLEKKEVDLIKKLGVNILEYLDLIDKLINTKSKADKMLMTKVPPMVQRKWKNFNIGEVIKRNNDILKSYVQCVNKFICKQEGDK